MIGSEISQVYGTETSSESAVIDMFGVQKTLGTFHVFSFGLKLE